MQIIFINLTYSSSPKSQMQLIPEIRCHSSMLIEKNNQWFVRVVNVHRWIKLYLSTGLLLNIWDEYTYNIIFFFKINYLHKIALEVSYHYIFNIIFSSLYNSLDKDRSFVSITFLKNALLQATINIFPHYCLWLCWQEQ